MKVDARARTEHCLQTFLERLKNAVFYFGTLLGEQWRVVQPEAEIPEEAGRCRYSARTC